MAPEFTAAGEHQCLRRAVWKGVARVGHIDVTSTERTNAAVRRFADRLAKALSGECVPLAKSYKEVFGNFHFPGVANVNNVTIAALDPVAKIPEYKVWAVRVEPLAETGS